MKKLILLCSLIMLLVACNNKHSSTSVQVEVTVDTESNVDIINGIYTSFSEGDVDGFLSALDEKVIWNEAENFPYDDGNPYIGHQAIVDGVLARIGGEWDNFTVDETEAHHMANNKVLVTGRYKGSNKKTGKSINAQVAHFWTLKDGKVIQFQQYTDTKQFADAIVE